MFGSMTSPMVVHPAEALSTERKELVREKTNLCKLMDLSEYLCDTSTITEDRHIKQVKSGNIMSFRVILLGAFWVTHPIQLQR
jgi:hypothetical protein